MGIKEKAELEAVQREVTNMSDVVSIAFVKMAENGDIDDVTASEHRDLFIQWISSVDYNVGDLRLFGEGEDQKLYRCVQAHTSQEGWEPNVAVSLWSATSDPTEEWPQWSQPIGAHDVYAVGAKVSHNDLHWVSIVDNNVWEPGSYGWEDDRFGKARIPSEHKKSEILE